MNITGYGQYSKATRGIRDPKTTLDTQLRLIFIYPILMADRVKVQSNPPFDQLVRDFLSVTFLTDLFVENTFSIISVANQIRPLWDDRNKPVGITKELVQSQSRTSSTSDRREYDEFGYSADVLQKKINQKTAIIQRLLKTDPKFAKFRPYVETITMGNMIDIPVIVGTTLFPVDTLTLMWVLIASIGLNRSLDSEANIDFIFDKLEDLDKKDYWTLLNNLIENPTELEYLGNWFQRGVIGLSRGVRKVTRRFGILPSVQRAASSVITRTQAKIQRDDKGEFVPQEQFAPLYLKQTDLDNTKRYFKFVLNRQAAERRFGIGTTDKLSSRTTAFKTSLSTTSSRYSNILIDLFMDTLSTTGTILLLSIGNLIRINGSDLNITEVKKKAIDNKLDDDIKDVVNQLFVDINNSLQAEDPTERINLLKELCSSNSTEAFEYIEEKIGESAIPSTSFNTSQYLFFMDIFEKASATSSSLSTKLQRQIMHLISKNMQSSFRTNLVKLNSILNHSIERFMREFIEEEKQTLDAEFVLESLEIADRNKILNQIIPALSKGTLDIFYFLFLSKLQDVLCRFIPIADIEIERASNEVTAWPNYTLVLPVEIVIALHAAIMGKGWRHILTGGRLGQPLQPDSRPPTKSQINIPSINDTYVKGIVKFIANRLNVPNLFVVDSKKKEVYYQLMNQTDVNKSKIQTLITFVQSKLDRPLYT